MRRVRRLSSDVHIELTPMIDVVFLLLTFFLFAVVMMVRADVLNVRLPELAAGQPSQSTVPITIAIKDSGELYINGEPTTFETVISQIESLQTQIGQSPLVIAVDVRSPAGAMITLADTLTGAGFGEFSIIGQRASSETTTQANSPQPSAQSSIQP